MDKNIKLFEVLIDGGRPAYLTKAQLIRVFGSEKLVQRLLYASRRLSGKPWLIFHRLRRNLLVRTESVESAVERMKAEQPPLLPSEVRRRSNVRREEFSAAAANAKSAGDHL